MPEAPAALPPLPPECMDFVLHVWDYLDDRLPPERARALRDHIARCNNCQAYQSFQSGFLAALARLREQNVAPSVLKARVARMLRDEGFSTR